MKIAKTKNQRLVAEIKALRKALKAAANTIDQQSEAIDLVATHFRDDFRAGTAFEADHPGGIESLETLGQSTKAASNFIKINF